MESRYDPDLQEIMSLIVNKSPKSKIISRAKEVKIEITRAWSDAQMAIAFLDQMVNRYSPDPDYPQGFFMQNPTPILVRPRALTSSVPTKVSVITDTAHVLELALRFASDGVIETKNIINQLRTEGDQRPERDIAKSIGNILSRNNWERIGTGKYKLLEQKQIKEVEPASTQK